MLEWSFWIVCVMWLLMAAGWYFDSCRWQKERRELLNRLMARDYHEYAHMERKAPPKPTENWLQNRIKHVYQQKSREHDDE